MNLYIITGASRGMGAALAQQLILPGNSLLCISRQTNADLANLAEQQQVPFAQWRFDLQDAAQAATELQAWLKPQLAKADSITLINNAGIIPLIAPLSEVPAAEIAKALRVGIEAPMLLTAAFLKATAHFSGAKKVLNISSGLGRRAMASQAGYCAAKAAMDHFTRCLALEEALKPHGAKVCSLAPGVIDTDMQVQLRGADAKAFPDREAFVQLKSGGKLDTPAAAAAKVIAYLHRADFGANPVGDVRDA
ncbi:MAG: SDR family NAD(P)-dependent oxidoreductase [Brachymonas sp.]|nr:SDR family NAD(P)-dependent oxidoreductase [Brachymonas sp.]